MVMNGPHKGALCTYSLHAYIHIVQHKEHARAHTLRWWVGNTCTKNVHVYVHILVQMYRCTSTRLMCASLVASELVKASAVCCGFKSHPRQLIFL